ncbi:MAG: DUF5110 domain-containing protein [Planctomycetes bacterium]|nr:DUF5110 domain-containing protein [Planctomycetota bacterium]
MKSAHKAAILLIISLGACASTGGQLVTDPWPRMPLVWHPVPKPPAFLRDRASLVAYEQGIRIEASSPLAGITRVRVAKGEFDKIPSFAVVARHGGALAPEVELEGAAREVIRNLMFSDGAEWRWFRALDNDEFVIGLGERPDSYLQRGRRAVMWNSDNFSYPPDAERLYQSIPFWITLKHGRARGFFIDNTYRMGFDAGAKRSEVFEAAAEAGDFNLYIIEGPSPRDVVERYTQLTGRPALPPLWALGYQQCRWSYDSKEWVMNVARGFRENKIPCDVIYTDIDYMDEYRCFTIDEKRFPDFKQMTADLGAMGFRVVSIVDPGLKRDSGWNVYDDGLANGFYIKTPEGDPYVGRVWAGKSVFPDFTRADVREWWGNLYKPLLDAGIAGFWNDMNEPSVFNGPDKTVPEEMIHSIGNHARVHNIYGMLMAQATRDGIVRLRPDKRPFVLTRANYAGGQRFAATWTGDNRALWPELRRSISMTLNLGMCGQPFAGPDIGGFNTNMETGDPRFADCTPELHARWLEFGALLPIARSHTIRGSMDREPYAYGEPWTSYNKESIERRYRLLPYLYSLADEAARTGAPIARPLLWIAPDDADAIRADDEFLLGDNLLIAPVTEQGKTSRIVYFPAGEWYPFDPNHPAPAKAIEGPARVEVEAPIGKLPIFARGGAIIPIGPAVQNVNELDPASTPEIFVFPGNGAFRLYEDSGDGVDYTNTAAHAATAFKASTERGVETLTCARVEGTYGADAKRTRRIHFVGESAIASATMADTLLNSEVRSDGRPPR